MWHERGVGGHVSRGGRRRRRRRRRRSRSVSSSRWN